MKRSHKALVAAGVILFALGLTVIAGQQPQEYLTVEEVHDAPDAHADGPVQVVAVVVPGTIHQTSDGLTRFTIRGEDVDRTLDVAYDKGLTDAFGADKWVVVTGTAVRDAETGEVTFRAEDVQVGCPSKWNAKKGDV